MMTNLECLLFALDLQGGTIHQMEKETGVSAFDLMHGKPEYTYLGSDHRSGSCAVSTCSVEFNKRVNFAKNHGNKDFWLGVIDGIKTMDKLDQIRPTLSDRIIKAAFSKG